MPRGIWRWVDETGGSDAWWARVEVRHGEWIDVEFAQYERAAYQPRFWELPLKEDHFEAVMRDPLREAEYELEKRFVFPGIIALMFAGGVAFVLFVAIAAVLAKLHLLD